MGEMLLIFISGSAFRSSNPQRIYQGCTCNWLTLYLIGKRSPFAVGGGGGARHGHNFEQFSCDIAHSAAQKGSDATDVRYRVATLVKK